MYRALGWSFMVSTSGAFSFSLFFPTSAIPFYIPVLSIADYYILYHKLTPTSDKSRGSLYSNIVEMCKSWFPPLVIFSFSFGGFFPSSSRLPGLLYYHSGTGSRAYHNFKRIQHLPFAIQWFIQHFCFFPLFSFLQCNGVPSLTPILHSIELHNPITGKWSPWGGRWMEERGPYPKSGRYHWLGLPPFEPYLSSAIASNLREFLLLSSHLLFFSFPSAKRVSGCWNLGMPARTS